MTYTDYINETTELVKEFLTHTIDQIDVNDSDNVKTQLRENEVVLGSEIREKMTRDQLGSTLGETVLDKKFLDTAKKVVSDEDMFDAFYHGPYEVDQLIRSVSIEELDLESMIDEIRNR